MGRGVTMDCQLTFRGYHTIFKRKSGHFEEQSGLRLLKRESCNCVSCGHFLDYINDTFCDYPSYIVEGGIEHDKKYTALYDGDEVYFKIKE